MQSNRHRWYNQTRCVWWCWWAQPIFGIYLRLLIYWIHNARYVIMNAVAVFLWQPRKKKPMKSHHRSHIHSSLQTDTLFSVENFSNGNHAREKTIYIYIYKQWQLIKTGKINSDCLFVRALGYRCEVLCMRAWRTDTMMGCRVDTLSTTNPINEIWLSLTNWQLLLLFSRLFLGYLPLCMIWIFVCACFFSVCFFSTKTFHC